MGCVEDLDSRGKRMSGHNLGQVHVYVQHKRKLQKCLEEVTEMS